MGTWYSIPEQHIFRHLTWNAEDTKTFQKRILEWEEKSKFEDKRIRILMCGRTGSGKSSFINTLISCLNDRVLRAQHSASRETRKSTTTLVSVEKPFAGKDSYFEFMDMPGLFSMADREEHDNFVREFLTNAVRGKLQIGRECSPENVQLIDNPEPMDVPCCVVLIWQAGKKPDRLLKECFSILHKEAGAKKLKTVLVLTKIDLVDEALKSDLRQLSFSSDVANAVEEATEQFSFTPNFIFPVKNIHDEMTIEEPMKYLHLFTLDQILADAQREALRRITP